MSIPQGQYRVNPRPEVVPFVPTDASRVLDVGCASGGFGNLLRKSRPDITVLQGVEPVGAEALLARESGYDVVHEGHFPADVVARPNSFDGIILNDVLEHMIDPWSALREAPRFLKQAGWVVASIPSIQFLPVWMKVFRGSWEYTQEGTLDRTHLRFFTRSSMIAMFEEAGFEVERVFGINSMFDQPSYRKLKFLRRLIGDRQYVQFVVVARLPAR